MYKGRSKAGFTLIEALVSAALAAFGISAVLGGYASLTHQQSLMIRKEEMSRLAHEKLEELIATVDLTTPNGDFQDRNETRYVWDATTIQTGVTNLVELQVTVSPTQNSDNLQEVATGLVYQVPQTGTSGGPTG